MFDNKVLVERGKELSFLLRHDKSYKFDKHGWRTIDDLVTNHNYSIELIEEIVETNNKKRYEFNEDKTLIRARQGHSVNVDVELKKETPPNVLYHGTGKNAVDSIKKSGINKGSRLYVHLSKDIETAKSVGKRHDDEVSIFYVDAKKMTEDNIDFFLSNNGVWLTDYVDPKYLIGILNIY